MDQLVIPAPNAPAGGADIVAGDGWWPDLSIAEFQQLYRLPAAIEPGRIGEALVAAMIQVASDQGVAAWRAAREAVGDASLEEVEGPSFGGANQPLRLWKRAVHSYAAADLADTHNDITATEGGRERNEIRATSADEHRRNAIHAIRMLLGKRRNKVVVV